MRVEQSDIELMHERSGLVRRSSGKGGDVQTGAETLSHRARDHDRSHGVVVGRALKRGDHAAHHR